MSALVPHAQDDLGPHRRPAGAAGVVDRTDRHASHQPTGRMPDGQGEAKADDHLLIGGHGTGDRWGIHPTRLEAEDLDGEAARLGQSVGEVEAHRHGASGGHLGGVGPQGGGGLRGARGGGGRRGHPVLTSTGSVVGSQGGVPGTVVVLGAVVALAPQTGAAVPRVVEMRTVTWGAAPTGKATATT